jgi:hypothetical protein
MFGATFSGVSTAPLERWREALSPAEIRTLEVWLGPLMAQYGWPSQHARPSWPAQARDLLLGGSHNLRAKARMVRGLWRARQRQERAA